MSITTCVRLTSPSRISLGYSTTSPLKPYLQMYTTKASAKLLRGPSDIRSMHHLYHRVTMTASGVHDHTTRFEHHGQRFKLGVGLVT